MIKSPKDNGAVHSIVPLHGPGTVKHVHFCHLRSAPVDLLSVSQVPSTEPGPSMSDEESDGEWWIVPQAEANRLDTNDNLVPLAEPQVAEETGSDQGEVSDGASRASGFQPRRSTRKTAGKHSNVYHLPVVTWAMASGAAVSQVSGSSNLTLAVFRPWV